MSTISFLMAVLNALPILDKWFQEAAVVYVKMQKAKNNAEFLSALEDAKKDEVEALARSLGKHLK